MKLPTINYRRSAITLVQGFGIALLFSLFIYAEHYGLSNTYLNSVTALAAFYFLLQAPRAVVVTAGGFIGLLWFYWIGYSFEFYGHPYMVPVITLLFACIYMLFFAPLALTNNYYLRAIFLFGLSYFEPFDFNWLQIEAIFVNSYFGVVKIQLAIILVVLASYYTFQTKKYSAVILLFLVLAVEPMKSMQTPLAPLKIKLVTTQIPQELKWRASMRESLVLANFLRIEEAINEGYDVVVLPESAFALFLNHHLEILRRLEKLSRKIAIVTGALYSDREHNYNVTYIFEDGSYSIAKKMILVPFGEYIPLPEFMRHFINQTFFDGAEDYTPAYKPTDYTIKNITFRNAICYEVTCEEIYENNPPYIIAMSNNAWFTPSIEPTLQQLLMKYYAKKHNTVIYHSTNIAKSAIVKY